MLGWFFTRKFFLNCPWKVANNWADILTSGGYCVDVMKKEECQNNTIDVVGKVRHHKMENVRGAAEIRITKHLHCSIQNDIVQIQVSGRNLAESLVRILLSCDCHLASSIEQSVCLSIFRCELNKNMEIFFSDLGFVLFPDCRTKEIKTFIKKYAERNCELYMQKPIVNRIGVGYTELCGSYFAVCGSINSSEEWHNSRTYQQIKQMKDEYNLNELPIYFDKKDELNE